MRLSSSFYVPSYPRQERASGTLNPESTRELLYRAQKAIRSSQEIQEKYRSLSPPEKDFNPSASVFHGLSSHIGTNYKGGASAEDPHLSRSAMFNTNHVNPPKIMHHSQVTIDPIQVPSGLSGDFYRFPSRNTGNRFAIDYPSISKALSHSQDRFDSFSGSSRVNFHLPERYGNDLSLRPLSSLLVSPERNRFHMSASQQISEPKEHFSLKKSSEFPRQQNQEKERKISPIEVIQMKRKNQREFTEIADAISSKLSKSLLYRDKSTTDGFGVSFYSKEQGKFLVDHPRVEAYMSKIKKLNESVYEKEKRLHLIHEPIKKSLKEGASVRDLIRPNDHQMLNSQIISNRHYLKTLLA